MNFRLSIETGNDAMQSHDAVAQALHTVAERVEQGYGDGAIRDLNGNPVGRWDLTDDGDGDD